MLPFISIFSLLSLVFSPSAAAGEDTLTLQKWEYCAGCKITVEHFLRHALEAIRHSEADTGRAFVEEPLPFDLEPTIDELCYANYFHNFVPEMRYACQFLMRDHKDELMKFNNYETVDDQRNALRPTKSNFYDISKRICLDTAKACPKYMYPKKPISQKDRTYCKACAITGECMEVMKAVTLHQTNQDIVENVCESIGYNHQPSGWVEEYCYEIVEDNEGDMVDILNHYDFDRKLSITSKLCEETLGCSEKDTDIYRA